MTAHRRCSFSLGATLVAVTLICAVTAAAVLISAVLPKSLNVTPSSAGVGRQELASNSN